MRRLLKDLLNIALILVVVAPALYGIGTLAWYIITGVNLFAEWDDDRVLALALWTPLTTMLAAGFIE